MKKAIYAICFIAFLIGNSGLSAQGTWVQKKDIGSNQIGGPSVRGDAVAFSINHKGYIGTGVPNGQPFKDFWEYDATSNVWTQKADFGGVGRFVAVGFSIGNKGYVGTGDTVCGYNFPVKDFWEYDPASNVWTRKADYGGGETRQAVGFSIDSFGYIGTGFTADYHWKNDFWQYNPNTDIWVQKADFPGIPRIGAIGFGIDSFGYIGLGSDSLGGGDIDFWQYNPTTDAWNSEANFPGGSTLSDAAFSIGGLGYVGTGWITTAFYAYDPIANSWTQKANCGSIGRREATGFSVDSLGYIGFGIGASQVYGDVYQYNPNIDTWSQIADFGNAGREFPVGFNINGMCYVGLGDNGSNLMNDFWGFEPITNVWTQLAAFAGSPRSGAVGFSIGSKGYVGLGDTVFGTNAYTGDFWEYDPSTNSWVEKADFGGSGRVYAVGFSIANMGYVGTGWDTNINNFTRDFWGYDVLSDSWSQKADFGGAIRAFAIGFNIDSNGYLGLGVDNGHIMQNDFWEYLPPTDTWVQKANFAGSPRYGAFGFGIGSNGYIGTGNVSWGGTVLNDDFWEFNPATNIWNQEAILTGGSRWASIGFSDNNKGYISSGQTNFDFASDFWEFTPACVPINQTLCMVTIDTTANKPIVIWNKANKYATDSFYVFRARTPDTVYAQVGAIGRDSLSAWEDISAYPDSMSYRYEIATLDTCGSMSALSPYHQTIYLQSPGAGQYSWTPYAIQYDTAAIGTYSFYRDALGTGVWQLLYTVPDSVTTAMDSNYTSYPYARYKVVITLANPCTPTRGITTITSNILGHLITGISEADPTRSIRIAPNPANDHLTITCSGFQTGNATISITDMLGRQVYKAAISNQSLTINTTDWQNGVYAVNVSDGNGMATSKVVKCQE